MIGSWLAPPTAPARGPRRPAPRRRPTGFRPEVGGLEGRLLLSDGTLDATFDLNGKAIVDFDLGGDDNDFATAVARQADGKIVVVGTARRATNRNDFAIARLNLDGSLDATFSGDGRQTVSFDVDADAAAVAIQGDGRIVVVGTVDNGNPGGDTDVGVVRLTTDGSLDTSFSSDGKRTIPFDLGGDNEDIGSAVAIQADGKIIVAGSVEQDAGGNFDFVVARLTTSGALDTSFDGNGFQVIAFDEGGNDNDRASSVLIQPDGRIVVAGTTQQPSGTDFAVARLLPSGALDTSFDSNGRQVVAFDLVAGGEDEASALAIQADGKIILAGSADAGGSAQEDFAVVRLTTAGALDTTFSSDGKRTIGFDLGSTNNDAARGVAIDPDGKIVVAGFALFTIFSLDIAVARLTTSGALDDTFDRDGRLTFGFNLGGGNSDLVAGVVVQPDGKIVMAGSAEDDSDSFFAVARLGTTPPPPPPRDTVAPRALEARVLRLRVRRGRRVKVTVQVVVRFSEEINPVLAATGGFYQVATIRRIGRRVTTRPVAVASATYDPASRTTTLTLAGKNALRGGGQMTILAALADPAGNGLDGNGDGRPGDAAVFGLN